MNDLQSSIYSMLERLENIQICSIGVYLMNNNSKRVTFYNINNVNFKITYTVDNYGFSIKINNGLIDTEVQSLLVQANIKEPDVKTLQNFVKTISKWQEVQAVYKRQYYKVC